VALHYATFFLRYSKARLERPFVDWSVPSELQVQATRRISSRLSAKHLLIVDPSLPIVNIVSFGEQGGA